MVMMFTLYAQLGVENGTVHIEDNTGTPGHYVSSTELFT
jgi:hypothetical protein